MKYLVVIILFLSIKMSFGQSDSSSVHSLEKIYKEKDELKRFSLLFNFTFSLSEKGYNENALDYAKKLLKLTQKLNNKNKEAKVYLLSSVICVNKSDYDQALIYAQKATKIYEELNDMQGIADICSVIGNMYYSAKKIDLAIKYTSRYLEIEKKLNFKRGIAAGYYNLAYIYSGYDSELELKYTKLSQQMSKEAGDNKSYILTTINLESCYFNRKEFKLANQLFNEAMSLAKKENDFALIGYLYNKHGKEYLMIKDYKKAFENFSKSTENYFKSDDKLGQIELYKNIGSYYEELNNNSKAQDFLLKALKIAQEIKAPVQIKEVAKLLNELCEKTNDFKNANKYYKLYSEQRDSIKTQKISEIELLYKFSKSEKEIEQLNTDKEIKESQITKNRIIILSISLFLALVIILFIIYINRQRAYKMIVRKNLEIVESEKRMNLLQEKTISLNAFNNEPTESETSYSVVIEKYLRSHLKDEKKTELLENLMKKIVTEKAYLNPDINLKILATSMGSNSNYLSQVINETFNQTFYNFINEFRIKEARRLLSDAANSNYTIEYISSQVGFRSKSSFNTAFKKYIGVTPSFYLVSTHNFQSQNIENAFEFVN